MVVLMRMRVSSPVNNDSWIGLDVVTAAHRLGLLVRAVHLTELNLGVSLLDNSSCVLPNWFLRKEQSEKKRERDAGVRGKELNFLCLVPEDLLPGRGGD